MKLATTLILLGAMTSVSFAQNSDAKSKEILDAVSKKTKTYKTIVADFASTMESKADKMKETQKGKVSIKGNMYMLELGGQKIYCDGATTWRYIKDDNEVQIDNMPDADEDGALNPSQLLTIYETGFKHTYLGEEVVAGVASHLINMFPLEPGEKNYHTVKLTIDKAKMQITSIVMKGKDGTDYTYEITKFDGTQDLPDTTFKFNKAKFPGVDEVDLR